MIQIRDAHPGDAAGIQRLIQAMADEDGETSPLTEETVRQYLSTPSSQILLAELGGAVAGLLSYSRRPDLYHAGECWLVEALVVESGYRDRGIGAALLKTVLGRAEAGGCREVAVGVAAENEGALRFYRRHGLDEQAVLLERHDLTGAARPAYLLKNGK